MILSLPAIRPKFCYSTNPDGIYLVNLSYPSVHFETPMTVSEGEKHLAWSFFDFERQEFIRYHTSCGIGGTAETDVLQIRAYVEKIMVYTRSLKKQNTVQMILTLGKRLITLPD